MTAVGDTAYSDPLTIEAAPAIVIDNPDITGGEDYATAVLGNPWDFEGPDDVAEFGNVTDVAFSDGILSGTNGGPDPGNPYIVLADNGDLHPGRYHRFTIETTYDGPFDLSATAGGGTHGRVSWKEDGQFTLHQSAEVVTYTDRSTYTIPLGTGGPELMESDNGAHPDYGVSRTAQGLRWDVNEDTGPRRWHIDQIRLAADDEAFGRFGIDWHDARHQPGTTVELFADTDARGFDGTLIASGLTQDDGTNTYDWDTAALPLGEYWVHARAASPNRVATSQTYATGPVRLRSPAPTAEPPGLRLAGASRMETAISLAQAAYPDGASTAILATAGSFPDALAAAPLAAALDAPVLLTPGDTLHLGTAAELRRLDVDQVILLGGTSALSGLVGAQALAIAGSVERVSGPERFATAAAVATEAAADWRSQGLDVGAPLIALGSRFEDALAAASLAGHARRPLLLTAAEQLPAATAAAPDDAGHADRCRWGQRDHRHRLCFPD